MLKENLISFPDADRFPIGPYDLDSTSCALLQDGTVELILQLGWVYDIYRLCVVAAKPVFWELWRDGSAVMHVDPGKVANNPRFVYSEFSITCDFQLNLQLDDQTIDERAIRIRFRPAVPELGFVIAFELESGSAVGLCALGWKLINEKPFDDIWPSDEWKDWNTM